MEAKTLIANLIEAIEALPASDLAKFAKPIEEAKESASLARLILPSLDAPPAAAPAATRVVRVEDTDTFYGPFPDDVAAQTFIDNLPGGEDAEIEDVHPPAALTGPVPTQAPQQSYDEVLDDLKQDTANRRPGSVIANKPPGSLYKH